MKPKGLGMAGMLDGRADAPLPNLAGAVQRVSQVWAVVGVWAAVCVPRPVGVLWCPLGVAGRYGACVVVRVLRPSAGELS